MEDSGEVIPMFAKNPRKKGKEGFYNIGGMKKGMKETTYKMATFVFI